jgi:hypothetical protein
MRFTCTLWLESLYTPVNRRGRRILCRSYQKYNPLSFHEVPTIGRLFFFFFFFFFFFYFLFFFIFFFNHTFYFIKHLYYLTCTKHDSTSAQCIFNGNTSVNGHKQRKVGFLKRKPLPKSSAYSTIISSI